MPIPLLLHGQQHAHYEPFGPWIVPWRFGTFDDEYRALRTAAGLIDYSTLAAIECRGADRTDFLQRILTNDLKRLVPGSGCRAALLSPESRLLAELLVLVEPERVWLFTSIERATVVLTELERYHFTEDLTLTNHERRHAVLALQGPRSYDALAGVLARELSLPNPGDHVLVPFGDISIWVIRHSLTREPGALLVTAAKHAEVVWELFRHRGHASGLQPVGWDALNTARIEDGLPWFGIDLDETNLLVETGLHPIVASDTKGCYVGQEIVARMQTYGSPNKRLMRLLIEGDDVPGAGDQLKRGGEPVGWITSACRSPALARPIAMGYVKRGADEPGTRVEIVRADARLIAAVVSLANSGETRGGG